MPRGLAALLLAAARRARAGAGRCRRNCPAGGLHARLCCALGGETLGGSTTTPAYSNRSAACFSRTAESRAGIFTGIRWQCVEYAHGAGGC